MLPGRVDDPVRRTVLKIKRCHQRVQLANNRTRESVKGMVQSFRMGAPVRRVRFCPVPMIYTNRDVSAVNGSYSQFESRFDVRLELARRESDLIVGSEVRRCDRAREDKAALYSGLTRYEHWSAKRLIDTWPVALSPSARRRSVVSDERVGERNTEALDEVVLPSFGCRSTGRPVGVYPLARLDEVQRTRQCLLNFAESESPLRLGDLGTQARLTQTSKPGDGASVKFPGAARVVEDHARLLGRVDAQSLFCRKAINVEAANVELPRKELDDCAHVRIDRRPDHEQVGSSKPSVRDQVSESSVSRRYVAVSGAVMLVLPTGPEPVLPGVAKRAAKSSVCSNSWTVSFMASASPFIFARRAHRSTEARQSIAVAGHQQPGES